MTTRATYTHRAPFTLDDRDLRVIGMLIAGATVKEISAAIDVGPSGVSIILFRARERFGAMNNEQLVAMIFRRGLMR